MGERGSPSLSASQGSVGTAPLPSDEPQRLVALKRYDLLDTVPEQAFDRITRLAATVLGMPVSLISLIDETRQWFKSRHGFDARWTRREIAFCSHAILAREPLVVPDAAADDRFAANPLVVEHPGIRFYAGAPLVTPEGYVLGTLCVIDRAPHPEFSDVQRGILKDFADLVMTEIEARSATLALRQKVREQQQAEQRLQRLLNEKETLLREVYHRVKNNLQVVDTLLALQGRQTPAISESLGDLRHRVYCLGLVHQKLMQSEDLETIDQGEFLRDLCHSLAAPYAAGRPDITMSVKVEPRSNAITIDFAISLGLLVNELVTNAFRHAFPTGRKGHVAVSLTGRGNGMARLVVADNGIGLPPAMLPGAPPAKIGQQIIAELVDQLGGEIAVEQDHGTIVSVNFPCPEGLSC
ncbi:GAF domain-containing protein (plasmid) [Skermanella sp. TT6]|uniref:histidine kinase n=1 Tax=Skermanella cutis TaxID=2775420 RepID=A0ABX7BLV5_9PROT|nr:GAF domain-containing protein [Skermanella sp. TT6]QQP93423.1 GAF domain-containing protein [Skermanella sp. TT6]